VNRLSGTHGFSFHDDGAGFFAGVSIHIGKMSVPLPAQSGFWFGNGSRDYLRLPKITKPDRIWNFQGQYSSITE
jgi:hypothetical protein